MNALTIKASTSIKAPPTYASDDILSALGLRAVAMIAAVNTADTARPHTQSGNKATAKEIECGVILVTLYHAFDVYARQQGKYVCL